VFSEVLRKSIHGARSSDPPIRFLHVIHRWIIEVADILHQAAAQQRRRNAKPQRLIESPAQMRLEKSDRQWDQSLQVMALFAREAGTRNLVAGEVCLCC
jgi:hypothetical protein